MIWQHIESNPPVQVYLLCNLCHTYVILCAEYTYEDESVFQSIANRNYLNCSVASLRMDGHDISTYSFSLFFIVTLMLCVVVVVVDPTVRDYIVYASRHVAPFP